MSAAVHSVQISGVLFQAAIRHAEQLGVSTQEWVHIALTERLRLEEEDAALWQQRAVRATGRRLDEILQGANDNPPDPGDELPDGWKRAG